MVRSGWVVCLPYSLIRSDFSCERRVLRGSLTLAAAAGIVMGRWDEQRILPHQYKASLRGDGERFIKSARMSVRWSVIAAMILHGMAKMGSPDEQVALLPAVCFTP